MWRAYIPELEAKLAATWGHTREEAHRNVQEVAQMIMEELEQDGEPLPPSVTVSDQSLATVSLVEGPVASNNFMQEVEKLPVQERER